MIGSEYISLLLADSQNFRESDYGCTNVLMRYIRLSNSPNNFWCSGWVIKSSIWIICLIKWE